MLGEGGVSGGDRGQFFTNIGPPQLGGRFLQWGAISQAGTLSNSQASAYPGAACPDSLAVTRANPTRCRQRKASRVVAKSLVVVR